MPDGKGCVCAARSSYECACDADWTPKEVYQLRARIKVLEEMEREVLSLSHPNIKMMVKDTEDRLGKQMANMMTQHNREKNRLEDELSEAVRVIEAVRKEVLYRGGQYCSEELKDTLKAYDANEKES